ncbi:hypothetical protein NQT66_05660 [Cellulophaga baltica]|uniref:HNH endonuclease n=1 Tax=Cellulophaga baltica TaxID=76594 RepID=UPI002147698F|nr:hypothetical protein [Cellulophaga baltica]MCR1024284.1 hypothetical protein [Cellulophaga baltica]
MKIDINDSLLRQAIWESYKGICYYSKKPIKIYEMELDHVIPKSLLKIPSEKKKVLESLNLPLDFDILDIKNIVPCIFEENRKKGTIILPNTTNILGDIERKLNSIEKIYKKLKKEVQNNRYLSCLSESVKSGELNIEEAYSIITNIKPYSQFESYLDNFHHAHFSSSTKRVFLNGSLPRPNKESSSCCISFKSREISGFMLTLTEEKIFELTNPSHREKTYKKRPHPKDSPELKNTVFFNYNGANFFLDINEMMEFYSLLDRYRTKIEIHRQKLNEYYGVEKFKLSNSKNDYRLGKIKRRLWFLMLRFASEYDNASGNTSWHMFDSNNNTRLRVNSGINFNQKYNAGFHASFIPEQIEHTYYYDFKSNDDEMWLLWNQTEPNGWNRDFKNYSIKNVWNAEISYKWITEEFIPYVIWSYEVSKKDKILKYRTYERYKSSFEIGKYIWF